jgi:DNA repair exonuclease SbcCD ATPase subunit
LIWKKKNKTENPSTILGFFGGQSSNQLEEIAILKKELEVLREDLECKIQENEGVHIQRFEMKQQHEQAVLKLRETISDLQSQLQQRENILQNNLKEQEETARRQRLERKQLQEKIAQLKQSIVESQELHDQLQFQIQQSHEQYQLLLEIHDRKCHLLDDTRYYQFNTLNLPPYDTRFIDSIKELWEKNLLIYLRQLCKSLTGLYALVDQKVQYLSGQPLFHVMKYVHNRITTQPIDVLVTNTKNNEKLLNDVERYIKICLNNASQEVGKTQMVSSLRETFRKWLQFNQRSLLYLVVCMQSSGDCTLNKVYEEDEAYEPNDEEDDKLLHDLTSSVKMGSNIETEEDEKFVSFYQEIYLRNNALTRSYRELVDTIQAYLDSQPSDVNVEAISTRLSNSIKALFACIETAHQSGSTSAGSSSGTGVSPTLKTLNDKILQTLGSIQQNILPNLFKTVLGMERISKRYKLERFVRGTTIASPMDQEEYHQLYYRRNSNAGLNGINTDEENGDMKALTYMAERAKTYMKRVLERFEQDSREYENISQREAIQNKKDLLSLQEHCKSLETELRRYEELDNFLRERQSHVNRLEQRVVDLLVEFQTFAQREQWVDHISPVTVDDTTDIVDKLDRLGDFIRQLMSIVSDRLRKLMRDKNELEREQQERYQVDVERQISEASNDGETTATVSRSKDAIVLVRRTSGTSRHPFSDLFTSSEISREHALKQSYEKRLEYLMRQIEVCDEKSVEYRVQWQVAVAQLEQAMEHERQMQLQLQQTRDMLERTKDELKTVRINYENQIQVLSDSLTVIKEQEPTGKGIMSMFGGETKTVDTPSGGGVGTLFDFWGKRN